MTVPHPHNGKQQGLLTAPTADAKDNTHGMLETILNSVKNIEGDLMTSSKSKAAGGGYVDPVSNFPTLTPKHNSLAANVLLNRPDLYTKYCNSVTSSGFTFDNAIQVGHVYVLMVRVSHVFYPRGLP